MILSRSVTQSLAISCSIGAALFGSVPSSPATASASGLAPVNALRTTQAPGGLLLPTTALGAVRAVGLAGTSAPVYVAADSGLYRSATSTFALWARQSPITTVVALAPNPQVPDDLVYCNHGQIYRSLDGGRTATRVVDAGPAWDAQDGSACFIVRSSNQPSILYASWLVLSSTYNLWKSMDDGLTWSAVLTGTDDYGDSEGFGPLAIDPLTPDHVVVAQTFAHSAGEVLATMDGGLTWNQLPHPNVPGVAFTPYTWDAETHPIALAFSPNPPHRLWVARNQLPGALESEDNGRSWRTISPAIGAATSIAIDPLTGRLYISTYRVSADDSTANTAIYAVGDEQALQPFGPTLSSNGIGHIQLAATANGYLLMWDGLAPRPLSVTPLIGPGRWSLAAAIAPSSHADRLRLSLLGHEISPQSVCDGSPCQYFDKGAIRAIKRGSLAVVALVPRLIGAQSALPVGGTTSTVTYRTLFEQHAKRTPPPAGFNQGTVPVRGGMFIPYSPTLASATGYVVPPYFWRYMSDRRNAPDGWLHDIGLPLTPAVQAIVSKGELGRRRIMLQAFQDAVLTYDARNAGPFRVERANVGVDYATAFPQAVR